MRKACKDTKIVDCGYTNVTLLTKPDNFIFGVRNEAPGDYFVMARSLILMLAESKFRFSKSVPLCLGIEFGCTCVCLVSTPITMDEALAWAQCV